jgi:hypothetical protein
MPPEWNDPDLRDIKEEDIIRMGKEFRKLLSNPAKAVVSAEDIGGRFKKVLDNLLIRRTDETDYLGHHIVHLPELVRVECLILGPSRWDANVAAVRDRTSVRVKAELRKRHKIWEHDGKKGPEPTDVMSNKEFLNRTQTLPYLATMIIDKNVPIRGVNREVLSGRHLLQNTLYDQHYQGIIKHNPKLDGLKRILSSLEDNEKMVIVSNLLPVALVVKHVSIMSCVHTLDGPIQSGGGGGGGVVLNEQGWRLANEQSSGSKSSILIRWDYFMQDEIQALVEGFQENRDYSKGDIDDEPPFMQEFRPRFLIESSILGIGLTLTAATHVVLMEPANLRGTEEQYRKRIHRIGQKRKCTVWRLVFQPSIEEFAILERQANRTVFIMHSYNNRLSPEQLENVKLDTKQSAVATAK